MEQQKSPCREVIRAAALKLQRPMLDDALKIVGHGMKKDGRMDADPS